ncbi:hypothetical protein Snoj_50290 [Streptomyces nojiriensis]|uniref:Uncharacterized protein n=1 Tax=Streptomyces nojiriensis TaxID=66374 RepID=A0ABQ3SSI5_9ACTN|nr:hypothetical protein [Streptomyces nojiriensis]GGS04355.1 hypothetical protein GCM10010205_36640 [Streptomyces nojiriensis]GHI71111.1 hypothetical protein Snoj_50290 [Streptomyces nojiriensis]
MGTAVATPVRLSVRRGDEAVVEDLEWPSVPLELLGETRPSRLELGRLLFADFAAGVRHIVALVVIGSFGSAACQRGALNLRQEPTQATPFGFGQRAQTASARHRDSCGENR